MSVDRNVNHSYYVEDPEISDYFDQNQCMYLSDFNEPYNDIKKDYHQFMVKQLESVDPKYQIEKSVTDYRGLIL